MVKQPTRFQNLQSPTTDDWVLTNLEDRISNLSVGPSLGLSDHATISFNIDTSFETLETKPRYQYYKGNFEAMREELENTDWESLTGSWTTFENFFNGLVERHVPKKRYLSKKQPAWLNRTTRGAILKKHKAWNKYQKCRSDQNWDLYAITRNNTQSEIRLAKQTFEDKLIADVKENPKAFWKYVGNKSGSKSGIGDLIGPGNDIVEDEQDKANLLNQYFSSVFTKENTSTIPDPNPITSTN